jgi:hypothetical protein
MNSPAVRTSRFLKSALLRILLMGGVCNKKSSAGELGCQNDRCRPTGLHRRMVHCGHLHRRWRARPLERHRRAIRATPRNSPDYPTHYQEP